MSLEEFVKGFAEQFDETDESEITAETHFHDLDEWSSLIGMSLIAFIRTEYGKKLQVMRFELVIQLNLYMNWCCQSNE